MKLVLAKSQVDRVIGAVFQYGAFRITVGHAVYDPVTRHLTVGLRFRNLSGAWHQSEIVGDVTIAGVSTAFSGRAFWVPPQASIDTTGMALSLPSDPTNGGVSLRWGVPGYNRPEVPLDGSAPRGTWLPTPVKVAGWAHIGKFAVEATGGEILAGQLSRGIQANEHERILRVTFDEYAAKSGGVNGFAPTDNLLLRRPDNVVVDAVDGSPGFGPLSWTSTVSNWVEFPIRDTLAGKYELLLAAAGKLAFGAAQPTLIERRPIPFLLGEVRTGRAPNEAPPVPDLTPPGTPTAGTPFDRSLSVGTINVPGFLYRPTRLRWDPARGVATMDGVATFIQNLSAANGTAALLSASPQFGFSELLVSQGRAFTGVIAGSPQVDPLRPTPIAIEFFSVDRLDPDDAALFIGASSGAPASLPLGRKAMVPLYPPAPVTTPIVVAAVTAGDWTVRLRSYCLGFVQNSFPPPTGRRDLEVSMDVTAASAARVGALGLSFAPKYEVLMADPTGYDIQAVADSGYVEHRPGHTLRMSVTFEVPETFRGGRVGFVIRSHSEVGELATSFVETRFVAQLGTVSSGAPASGGL